MTIRNLRTWCPTCEEACYHHPTHCTVCGAELTEEPTTSSTTTQHASQRTSATGTENNNNENRTNGSTRNTDILPEELRQEAMARGRELRQMISSLRQEMEETGVQQAQLLAQLQSMRQSMRDQWQTVPAHILNPQEEGSSSSRPTSKAFLEKIPKVVLQEHSSLLYRSTLKVKNGLQEITAMEGIIGDFNIKIQPQTQEGPLVIARKQRTCLGGLESEAKRELSSMEQANQKLLLLERGDGVTFVKKAMLAQEAGATACIIANNVDEPWPYVMKDSKAEAQQNHGLSIPTVMIKKSDAAKLYKMGATTRQSACLEIKQSSRDCVVCTETLTPGSTVMKLPGCHHVFHESCVMQWLVKHNTCPFCRREMPTDDESYEQERRRQQRTHAGSQGSTNSSNADFYG